MSDEPTFPVESFDEAYTHLRRPFTPAAVRFKVQATWDGGAMCITYIDARLVAGRLNMVVGGNWRPENFEPHPSGGLICHLNVCGVVRADYGYVSHSSADIGVKGTFSDALKRAAVQFGVGESLYVLPKMVVREGQHLKKKNNGKYMLTDSGEGYLRDRYKMWLDSGGADAFGEPLDHGDKVFATPDSVEQEAPASDEDPRLVPLRQIANKIDVPLDERQVIGEWLHESGELDEKRLEQATAAMRAGEVGRLLAEIQFNATETEAVA